MNTYIGDLTTTLIVMLGAVFILFNEDMVKGYTALRKRQFIYHTVLIILATLFCFSYTSFFKWAVNLYLNGYQILLGGITSVISQQLAHNITIFVLLFFGSFLPAGTIMGAQSLLKRRTLSHWMLLTWVFWLMQLILLTEYT